MNPTDTAFRLGHSQQSPPFSLLGTYVHLKDGGAAASLAGGPEFWSAIEKRPEGQTGRLVLTTRMEKDMPQWEMHPAGDELLVALSGAFEVVLQDGAGDRSIELSQGQAFLVPFGTWHRIRVKNPGEILFMTPGKGSQHRQL